MRNAVKFSKSIIVALLIFFLSLPCFGLDGDQILDNVQPEGGGTLDIQNVKSIISIDAITKSTLESALDFIASESDPVFTAWDKDYGDLSNKPTIIDWTVDQGDTNIHAGNYTDTNTTYTASGNLLDLTGTTFSVKAGTLTDTKYCTYSTGSGIVCNSDGGSMTYPGAGIALSTGSAWGTSITNNSANWNTAYGWGDHASAGYVTGTPWTSEGYLTSETDPVFTSWDKSTGISITESQISDLGTYLTSESDPLAVLKATFTADSQVLVGTGNGTYVAESGATLRTSLGLGTTDTPQFTGLNLATGELTVGSINRASGNLTLEINGAERLRVADSESIVFGNFGVRSLTSPAYLKLQRSTGGVEASLTADSGIFRILDSNSNTVYTSAVDVSHAWLIAGTQYMELTSAGLSLGTGELTAGSINRASGSLTLEIGGTAEQTITSTETTFGGNVVIPNAGYIGSASDTDAMQIEADGDVILSQGLSLTGTKGIGIYTAPSTLYGINITDLTFETSDTHFGSNIRLIKTGGTSDADDFLSGSESYIEMNQSGGEIGDLFGSSSTVALRNGTVGSVEMPSGIYGINATTRMTGGTVTQNVVTEYLSTNLDAGIIDGNVYGALNRVDIESAVTSIGGDVYGYYLNVDSAKDPVGSAYGLYLNTGANVDYAIYQNGTAPSVLGGSLFINTTSGIGSEKLRVNGTSYFDDSIGIGRTPSYKLDVQGATSTNGIALRNGSGTLITSMYVDASGAGRFRAWDNGGTERLAINAGSTSYITYGLAIGTSSLVGGEMLRVNGQIYSDGNISGLSFTDRTPYYEGDALTEIMKIKGKNGEIDHGSLPIFVRKQLTKNIYKDVEVKKKSEAVKEINGKYFKQEKIGEEVEEQRDLGAMISMLTVGEQQLYAEVINLRETVRGLQEKIKALGNKN